MPTKPHLNRIVTGDSDVDATLDSWVGAIEQALNVTAGPGLEMTRGPSGVHFAARFPLQFAIAKSGGSGIPAISGSTLGRASVTMYKVATSGANDLTFTTDGTSETAYNLSSSAVGNNKMLILVKILGSWFVIWEDCG